MYINYFLTVIIGVSIGVPIGIGMRLSSIQTGLLCGGITVLCIFLKA